MFHWATVTLCLLNFFVLEGQQTHRYAGYAVGIPHHPPAGGGWSALLRPLRPVVASPCQVRYLRQLAQGATLLPRPQSGRLPDDLAAAAVLVGTVVTSWLTTWDAFWGEVAGELHGIIANTLMAAVGVHAAVVLLTDRLTRSDLVRAMVLGKAGPRQHQVEDPRLMAGLPTSPLLCSPLICPKIYGHPFFAALISGVVVGLLKSIRRLDGECSPAPR